MQYPLRLLAYLSLALLLTACAPEGAHDGTIAVVNGQNRLIRDDQEKQRVCASTYCEPNYIVYQSFGRRRSNPAPVPPPPPANSPAPQAPPSASLPAGNYSHQRLNVGEAWKRTQGSSSVVVAIVDSGVDVQHSALKSHFAVNAGEANGVAGQDDDRNGFVDDVVGYDFLRDRGEPRDESGHGTHVAGIVKQIAPGARLLSLKFIGANGQGGTYNAIRAIDYAVARGVAVINASWGSGGYSQLLDQAIQRAISAGVTFVAAAGNDGMNFDFWPSYPAALPGVISVAASTRSDALADYSNYGYNVTIAAPGDRIVSTVVGGGHDEMSGTSMATPQVAGTVALLKSVRASVSESEVTQHLCQSSDRFTAGASRCGRMNTGRAVTHW